MYRISAGKYLSNMKSEYGKVMFRIKILIDVNFGARIHSRDESTNSDFTGRKNHRKMNRKNPPYNFVA